MRSASSIFLFAASAALVGAQTFPDESTLPGCGQTCFTNMLAESSTLGCTDESASCLCAIADFTNGLIGCANGACAADLVPSVTSYLYSVCYTATQYASAATSPTTSYYASTTAVVPTTTSTSAYVDTTAATYSSNGTYTGIAGIVPTTSGATATATSTTLKSSTTKGSSTASSTSTSTSASASASSTAAASSLSAGAKAGIGIGSAVGAVAVIAAIAALYITRKHNRSPGAGAIEISDPLPGAGRVYANEHDNSSELEMKSRRYEDMVPRQVPRTMV